MSHPIIRVERLSKCYRLGEVSTGTLVHDANRWWHRLRGKADPYAIVGNNNNYKSTEKNAELWALNDVSFEVKQGEIVGILGRNGAGKSTLLKILSRITTPTRGVAKVRGRLASLLEVGTGFHPELTGRENIFLNGAILGMSRFEVAAKFDEIVDFAGVGKFLDTPVKRYSSGMYVRLAFSVAAHLEPDVLVVDEVLAVGDAQFQRKCLGKMNEVASQQGRTILFVSHQLGMISSLCTRGLLISCGNLISDGKAAEVVHRFQTDNGTLADGRMQSAGFRDPYGRYVSSKLVCKPAAEGNIIDIMAPFSIELTYEVFQDVPKAPYPNFHFFDGTGACIFVAMPPGASSSEGKAGIYTATCRVPGGLFNTGTFSVGVALTFPHAGLHISFFEKGAIAFTVSEDIAATISSHRNYYSGSIPGPLRPIFDWEIVSERREILMPNS